MNRTTLVRIDQRKLYDWLSELENPGDIEGKLLRFTYAPGELLMHGGVSDAPRTPSLVVTGHPRPEKSRVPFPMRAILLMEPRSIRPESSESAFYCWRVQQLSKRAPTVNAQTAASGYTSRLDQQ
ncbi:uncharacterized protein PADG_12383 [Paracoccidioides brasiliensis Pb18]|uniref:Uncharacterized protein n=1 Tax=Paracoccidioides brasiliensis (strain Pb18) TaxID=502780 RepID=A0A0A0HVQ6_PARBD|nr:uncharacterized protein PADG_12383 [Paracoccidioides brasiliensis Pb18]KGM91525.1 hypothetical protein PADG_12383 [Paracoccidioides brasiliensis Pb18]